MNAFDLKNNFAGDVSVKPGEALSGSTPVTGVYLDMGETVGPVSGLFGVSDASGSPTGQTFTCQLLEADDNSGTGAQALGDSATITADNGFTIITAKNRSKRYVAAQMTPAFTGGTSPANKGGAFVVAHKQRY